MSQAPTTLALVPRESALPGVAARTSRWGRINVDVLCAELARGHTQLVAWVAAGGRARSPSVASRSVRRYLNRPWVMARLEEERAKVNATLERGWLKSCAAAEGILDNKGSTNLDLLGAATFFGKAGARFVQRMEVTGQALVAFAKLSTPQQTDEDEGE